MLREPLVHFLALGLALFLLYALVTPPKRGENQIVISAATLATIRDQYRQLWGRSPTAAELKTLVETRVTDEILYREGRAMGLDHRDPAEDGGEP